MDSESERFGRALASLEDDIATARAALADEEFDTLADLSFRTPLRRCLMRHATFNRDAAVQTVVGRSHLLRTEYLPEKNTDAIATCLDEFEAIVEELHQLNDQILPDE